MRTLLAIVALLCLASSLTAQPALPGPPLTAEEAARYVREHPDEAAADVMVLEAIERATPVVHGATLVVLATEDGRLLAYWDPKPEMSIEIAGRLRYVIKLPEASARMSRPPPFGAYLVGGVIGVGLGAAGMLLLAAALQ